MDPIMTLPPLRILLVEDNEHDRLAFRRAFRKINQELKSFTYIVSHDLKNPITYIQGFTSHLIENYGEKLDEKGRLCLERIKVSARLMEVLISDLLLLSRLGRIVGTFEVVSSIEIVKNVTSGLQDRL